MINPLACEEISTIHDHEQRSVEGYQNIMIELTSQKTIEEIQFSEKEDGMVLQHLHSIGGSRHPPPLPQHPHSKHGESGGVMVNPQACWSCQSPMTMGEACKRLPKHWNDQPDNEWDFKIQIIQYVYYFNHIAGSRHAPPPPPFTNPFPSTSESGG